jgi:uncharacterized protein YybS (DUF2232 family)
VLFGILLILPGLQVSLLGLIYCIIPLVVLFYLYKWEQGKKYVMAGLALAAAVSFFTQSFGVLLFTATFIPPGIALAESAFRSSTPAGSGLKGTIALIGSWLLLLAGFIVATGINPISEFLSSVNQGIEEAIVYYRQSDTMAPDTVALIEASFFQMKVVLPKILPSIIIGFALLTVWFTMLAGNNVIKKFTGYQPWIHQHYWQLPEKLIWILIGSALISMMPISGVPRQIGANILIVFSFLYFFQGFSIFSFFMEKWKLPLVMRFFLYGMVLLQQFGTILLLVIGVGDVWFDLRRLKIKDSDSDN